MKRIVMDLETWPIVPGLGNPPVAALQYKIDDGPVVVVPATYDRAAFVRAVRMCLSAPLIVGHNLAFDGACLCREGFKEEVFAAFDELRVHDTLTNSRLLDIAHGRMLSRPYDLRSCCERWGCPTIPDKDDPVRCRYSEVAGLAFELWPEEFKAYATNDVQSNAELYDAQLEEVTALVHRPGWYARNLLWLYLQTCVGLNVDLDQVERYGAVVKRRIAKEEQELMAAGLVVWEGTKAQPRRKKKRDTKAAKARMIAAFAPDPPPLTKPNPKTKKGGGGVCLNLEACEESGDALLVAYAEWGSATNRLTRIDGLRKGFIQASYVYPQETGRTSSRKMSFDGALIGDQIQNNPKEPGYRECYVAPRGYAFVSCDFEAYELVGWSQACHDLLGWSDMAEVINEGRDLHTQLAIALYRVEHGLAKTYEEIKALLKLGDEIAKKLRQAAKAPNFGFPGGMGPGRFARANHIPKEEAERIRKAWLLGWKQAKPYLEKVGGWIRDNEDDPITTQQLRSKRYRGNCTYSQACNTFFQGLCADAAMDAGWELTRESYLGRDRSGAPSVMARSRLVIFGHDDFVMVHPLDDLDACAKRQVVVQLEAAQKWFPNVVLRTSPAASARWAKDMAPVYDEAGRLTLWEPKGGWSAWFAALERDELCA